jgi:uncharacterized protein YbjT (DUF2867 family)
MTRILVTGATGNVGRTVAALLAADPTVQVRALTRDPGAATLLLPRTVAIAVGDFENPSSLDAALDGVDAVYLACGNVAGQVDFESTLIDRAAAAGVRRLVKLSAPGRRGRGAGRVLALARPGRAAPGRVGDPERRAPAELLMTNLLAAVPPAREHGVVFAPAATARISMVDPRDVAAVAATALAENGHEGRTYVVTGPAAITYHVMAASFGEALGRDVAYLDVTPDEARRAMLDQGLPPFVVDQLGAVFAALRRGEQESTTDIVASVTGRLPRSFREFAEHQLVEPARDGSTVLAPEPR